MEKIYYSVKVLNLLWGCMIFFVFAVSGNKSDQGDRFSTYFIMATMSLVLPVIQYGGGKAFPGAILWGFPWVSYAGFLLIFLGISIHLLGMLTLKDQWSPVVTVSTNHKLVDTGIYKFIRHPIYAALLLELFGFGLALTNWTLILMLIIPNAASLTYRIFVEEKSLEAHFGRDYINYEQRTKRLIPGIF